MSFQAQWEQNGDPAIQHAVISDFTLASGHVLPEARLGYCVFGCDASNPLVILHPALTGTPRAHTPGKPTQGDGWWSHCVGPKMFIDTEQLTVACVDHLGGNGDSTGAVELGELRSELSFADSVTLINAVLLSKGISHLHAVIGGSIGGGQVLEWLFQDDVKIERLLDISGNCSRAGMAPEFFAIQADLLEHDGRRVPELVDRLRENTSDLRGKTAGFDIAFDHVIDGLENLAQSYTKGQALHVARQIGFLRFVTPLFYQRKYDEDYRRSTDENLAAATLRSWLDYQGDSFTRRFSPEALASLCRMEAAAKPKTEQEVAARVAKTGCHLVSFAVGGDVLFDAQCQFDFYQEVRRALPDAKKDQVDILFAYDQENGHDHFLGARFLDNVPALARHLYDAEELSGFETRAIHEGQRFRDSTGALIPPIYLTSTFEQGNEGGFDYTRSGNPNFRNLEHILASFESASYATVFASGVSAITAVVSSLKSGDLVIAEEVIYGCTYRLFDQVFSKFGVSIEYYDFSDPKNFDVILQKNPVLVWVESPTNPLLKIIDIRELSKFTSRAGSTLLVDNTFASSYCQRPLELGADLSLVSTTKYINGHSDCLGGVVCTNSSAWTERMLFAQKALGLNPSPFDTWLVTRGLKTITLRMEKHQINALALTEFLGKQHEVEFVRYPLHPSHPQYDVARRQMDGGSGIVTAQFNLAPKEVGIFLSALDKFTIAESLGGIESLVCHPATMSHAAVPEHEKAQLGISDALIRFSVGVEKAEDLVDDIAQALDKVRID